MGTIECNHDVGERLLAADGLVAEGRCSICDAKELESLRQENSQLREALATWLKWWDHEVSGTEKGRIYRWTEELLNPPKRS